ncbi:hypothetical protein O6H91_03G082700 [Diphasiastrum complanatum]|uniref:Uncharacterized protein n=1 Tax=Diphasiastrum complanatum TaxID=34168 RepID=A0ACC2E8A7_DIPCM|nr:hypothetical protein O6H91_03G082700 [Diphasiastrum complanatum]
MEDERGLSAEDLKKELFLSLRSSGILNSLKSQLRASLFHQLRDYDATLSSTKKKNKLSLEERILSSLFFDYLEAYGYSFTQSVFVPESRIETVALFSYKELLQLLRLDLYPGTGELNLTDNGGKNRGCLMQHLVTIVQRLLVRASTKDSSTQTSGIGSKELIGTYLKEVDDRYHKMIEAEKRCPAKSLEERAKNMYEEFDERVRNEVDVQVRKVREFELDAVRVEEASHYRRQMAKARQELEDLHKNRLQQLRKSESSFREQLKAKEKELEAESFKHRQRMLEELQNLQEREEKLRNHSYLQEKTASQREQIVYEKEISLKVKEDDITLMREFLHNQADELISARRIELEKEYQTLQEQLLSDREVLEAEKESLKQERHAMLMELESARTRKELVAALRHRLSSEESRIVSLLQRIANLEDQLRSTHNP